MENVVKIRKMKEAGWKMENVALFGLFTSLHGEARDALIVRVRICVALLLFDACCLQSTILREVTPVFILLNK